MEKKVYIEELEQIKKFYNALMHNTEDYIVFCDNNGVSQAFNESYKKSWRRVIKNRA